MIKSLDQRLIKITRVQVNDLAQSLLALLLLPILLDTADKYDTIPRLVVVTSELHYWAKFDKALIDSPQPLRLFAHKDHMRGKYVLKS